MKGAVGLSENVIIVGSGAAGLSAALSAAIAGADVTVLEGDSRWGGATAVSGGQAWVPANHRMSQLGVEDSAQDAARYLRATTRARDPKLIDAFVDAAPRMARFIEDHSPIRWIPMRAPDSMAEQPGGRSAGRNLEVAPVETSDLGSVEELLWPAGYPTVLTNEEAFPLLTGGALPMELIRQRMADGVATGGAGLIVGLLRACRDAGVRLLRSQQVTRLQLNRGITVTTGDGEWTGDRVVLACGGYEHHPLLRDALMDGPYAYPVSPPVAHGAALRLGGEVGAKLAHVGEAWSWPVTPSTSQWPGGEAQYSLMLAERVMPHVIWVNGRGERFTNEAAHNCALAFSEIDPHTGQLRNCPAWAIADANHRQRYRLGGVTADQPLPTDVVEADELSELAARIGVDAGRLHNTVQRYNDQVAHGHDTDFGRGDCAYDRFMGDSTSPHPNLGTIARGPFFAVPVLPGLVGTKGGLSTDEYARVVDWNGEPITGLYAAGNAMAAPIGPGIVSSGSTIGSALTWGWIAGQSV